MIGFDPSGALPIRLRALSEDTIETFVAAVVVPSSTADGSAASRSASISCRRVTTSPLTGCAISASQSKR
jgi:hypothetical protein